MILTSIILYTAIIGGTTGFIVAILSLLTWNRTSTKFQNILENISLTSFAIVIAGILTHIIITLLDLILN